MTETTMRPLKIALQMVALSISSIAYIYAQTDKSDFEVGTEAGPFLFVASGGRETIGGFGLCVEPHVDYFLTDELAVGITGFFLRPLESDESGLFFGGVYAHMNYFFSSTSQFAPYVGVRIGAFNPNAESQFGLGPQIGFKLFVTRQFSINGQLDGAVHPGSEGTLFLSCLAIGISYHIK